ncbi:LCP family protein [Streptomyces sp. F63]|uniref:LCP family protein n=1 Tax=Streptomyces sp. F63 TaxID=2824887 RepID=UPI001B35D2F4|nr:LCP family protein [Streptomyces sp. F63]MBQ0986581.1 LCP family protein [Streptomyces sp. F63]
MTHSTADTGAQDAQHEDGPGRPGDGEKPGRGRRSGRRLRPAVLVPLTLLALLLALGGTGWWLYRDLDANLAHVDIDRALGDDRPEKLPTSGRNILVLGSDSRAGENAALDAGKAPGARSDTALVVHIPEGRSRATAVSIPRDTLVTRPECGTPSGRTLPEAGRVMFNSVYAQAGPACVVKTVERMSGIRMDHYMEIDFAGFRDLVDALGGVTITTDRAIDDKATGLRLGAGTHRLDGEEALRFVRTRHGIGDGSDLGRIGLQQQFLTALLTEIKQQEILTSPAKLYRIADAATASLTTDTAIGSLTGLADFGRSLQGIDPAAMETITLPVIQDERDPNRVVPVQPRAEELWKALRTGAAVPDTAKRSPVNGSSTG